jgi:hypothetical protein
LNSGLANRKEGGRGGQSGEFFFFSHDYKLVIKTISKKELRTLITHAQAFLDYFRGHPNTLISKIYGVFELEFADGEGFPVILMQNLNRGIGKDAIMRIYDLKGSTINRESIPTRAQIMQLSTDHSTKCEKVMKDMDFMQIHDTRGLPIHPNLKAVVIKQLKEDADFLRLRRLVDYSLVVTEVNETLAANYAQVMGKHPYLMVRTEAATGFAYNFGIIDYLVDYSWDKMLERAYKKVKTCDSGAHTTIQDPDTYSLRFAAFCDERL